MEQRTPAPRGERIPTTRLLRGTHVFYDWVERGSRLRPANIANPSPAWDVVLCLDGTF